MRHHRLQPRGASTSPYEPIRAASPTPPASAAWCFNFALRTEPLCISDTTGFSRVVLQFQPTTTYGMKRHHRLQPRGASTFRYEPSAFCFPDTTGFSRVVLQLRATHRAALHLRHHRLQPRGASTFRYEPSAFCFPDTTGFSRVVLQLCATNQAPFVFRTPPASAAWCFNFPLRTKRLLFSGHHPLQPRGASTFRYAPSRSASLDTTRFSRVVLQL